MDELVSLLVWFFLLSGVVSWVVIVSLMWHYWRSQSKKEK